MIKSFNLKSWVLINEVEKETDFRSYLDHKMHPVQYYIVKYIIATNELNLKFIKY